MPDARTPLFNLPIPSFGERNWGDKLSQYFADMEIALGTNSHVALAADTASGVTAAYGLGAYGASGTVVRANPSAGRWGRVVPQTTLSDGQLTLCMMLGTTRLSGVLGAGAGDTIYHDADSDQFTIAPENAVVVDSVGMRFLPLGFAFAGGVDGFFTGLMPVIECPGIQTGTFLEYKPGLLDPSGSFATVFDNGPALSLTFDVSGSTQTIDLLCQVMIPPDFLEWVDVDDPLAWAFKMLFKTTGSADLQVYSIFDTAGAEHSILGDAATSIGAYGALTLGQKSLHDLVSPAFARSGVISLRLRATGSDSEVIRIRPTAMMHYFPTVEWQV